LVTPYLADSNGGNWRTAARWKKLLAGRFRVILQNDWNPAERSDLLIALHARRSAKAIQAYRDACPRKPLVVVLTGTDLYRDLEVSVEARRSVEIADALIVLQEDARKHLPASDRGKAHVIYQSAPGLINLAKQDGRIRCVAVGHLRPEKSPTTIFEAMQMLPADAPIDFLHVGSALDPKLAIAARRAMKQDPRYRWCGPLPHGLARIAMQRAHLLVHPSVMEGGANVIVEAVTSGTAVLASNASGNIGMLGARYPGLFPVGDANALARLMVRSLEPAFFRRLKNACDARRPLYSPELERAQLCQVIGSLLDQTARPETGRRLHA
ncbi:MAG TPA: selenoneine biosynthesis selenosugar synthase SenB, partial [Usitatibacteraceae bacterium]|nr:selenoneine biosynthesis selenosugar synthase SenB [Usitatibacteraceae bacterium]